MSKPDGRELSLSQRIRLDLEQKILSGEWQPGVRIPFEHELMVRYACSRMTVSKAVASLVETGLVERRRRAGTFVRRPAGQSAILRIPDIRAEVLALRQTYSVEITHRSILPASPEEQTRLGQDVTGDLLQLTCLHRAGEEVYAFEDRLIILDAVPAARDARFDDEPPGTWLLNRVPWHEAEHRISAEAAPARIARLLGIETGAPCLVVERRTWASEGLLTFVRLWFSGARQSLVARFTPRAATPEG